LIDLRAVYQEFIEEAPNKLLVFSVVIIGCCFSGVLSFYKIITIKYTRPRGGEVEFRLEVIKRFRDRVVVFDLEYIKITSGQIKGDYDAVVWDDTSVLFIEFKSPTTYRNLKAKKAQS
jgi:hypothetical protein